MHAEQNLQRVHIQTTPGERVRWLLKNVWQGNRSAMARDCDCSHTVISKIASEDREPGRQLLSRIAEHPKVNPEWIFTGSGSPLLEATSKKPAGGWPVPIINSLLPGLLDQHRELFTGQWMQLPEGQYSDSRYFYRTSADTSLGLWANDLVLMETDPAAWKKNVLALDDRLCAIRMDTAESPIIQLAVVDCHPVRGKRDVELSARIGPAWGKTTAGGKRKAPPSSKRRKKILQQDDVVGVALFFIREF